MVMGVPTGGDASMPQGQKAARQQAMARRRTRKRRRLLLGISAPVVIAAIVAVVALRSPPEYSGFEILGKQPAIVQVFLPG
jgi:hypothetical protein